MDNLAITSLLPLLNGLYQITDAIKIQRQMQSQRQLFPT